MDKIIRIHEKILDHLLGYFKNGNELYFVPRKINNKQRLEKGYWFIGNESYLNLSFWNGTDWKERINNIGLIIDGGGKSYIELSAQDSDIKATFLEKVVAKIGGFKKDPSKRKWYKHYLENDYIQNIDSFIENIKPIIDNLIKKEKPEGIYHLDQNFYNSHIKKVIQLRERQIESGNINKLSRICWNNENWKFPSGSQGKSVSIDAYEADSGYGHEEWLFDKTRIIEDYHYAFLQPLLLKSDKHHDKAYNISLFTINNLNKQYYVGEIRNVIGISKEESLRIYEIYKANGWIRKMSDDVQKVGANYKKFNATEPEIFFNIKFQFKNVLKPDELIEIATDDINITTNHYKLLPKKSEFIFSIENDEDQGEGNMRNTDKRKKVFNIDCEYDPYHDQMQNAIFDLLKKSEKHEYKKVFIEKGRVDIKAITQSGTWHYFELKTDNPKISIRKALGQILEYAYFPDTEIAEKLIIVADEKPNSDVIKYLEHIRNTFGIPLTYRYFDLTTMFLSDDY